MPRVFVAVNVPGLEVPGRRPPADEAPDHFTLRFLGEVPPEALERVQRAMERAATGVAPFMVELVGVGAFPTPARPRVVWVGVRAGGEALVGLAGRLSASLAQEGWPPDPRAFSPHLTILRVNHARQAAEARRLLDLGSDRPFGQVHVEEMLLRESQLTRSGAIHTTLGSSILRAEVNPPPGSGAPPPSAATGRG
jgi:2'-5' RNA ligase